MLRICWQITGMNINMRPHLLFVYPVVFLLHWQLAHL